MEMKRSSCSSSSSDDFVRKKIKSSIMSSVPDDILEKILMRPPHFRSAILCGTVCKRWFSIISRSDFTSNFVDHIHRTKPPLRLLLGNNLIFNNHPIPNNIYNNNNNLPSSYSLPIPIAGILESFPWLNNLFQPDATLIAMCHDLLLIEMSDFNYCLCNPFTGQVRTIPPPPPLKSSSSSFYLARCGLVSEPNKKFQGKLRLTRYRIMLIYHIKEGKGKGKNYTCMRVFYSETGRWKTAEDNPMYLLLKNVDVVASKGILYWISLELGRLVTISLFGYQEQWASLHLPRYNMNDCDYNNLLQFKLGLVQGRPMMSQLRRLDCCHFSFKLWDIRNNNDYGLSWLLVHEDVIEFETADQVFVVIAFHPNNIDQIFMLHNCNLYQYDIKTNKRIKVVEIHSSNSCGDMPVLPIFPFVLPVCTTIIEEEKIDIFNDL